MAVIKRQYHLNLHNYRGLIEVCIDTQCQAWPTSQQFCSSKLINERIQLQMKYYFQIKTLHSVTFTPLNLN